MKCQLCDSQAIGHNSGGLFSTRPLLCVQHYDLVLLMTYLKRNALPLTLDNLKNLATRYQDKLSIKPTDIPRLLPQVLAKVQPQVMEATVQ